MDTFKHEIHELTALHIKETVLQSVISCDEIKIKLHKTKLNKITPSSITAQKMIGSLKGGNK